MKSRNKMKEPLKASFLTYNGQRKEIIFSNEKKCKKTEKKEIDLCGFSKEWHLSENEVCQKS